MDTNTPSLEDDLREVLMTMIRDDLREEARDYQDLAAMSYRAMVREGGGLYRVQGHAHRTPMARLCFMQEHIAWLGEIARSALFELIGAEPE